jgi:hypothetical protein
MLLIMLAELQEMLLLAIFVCIYIIFVGSTWWRSWLRLCATSRQVAGSIPNDVTGIFHCHNPSSHTMALGSTQPVTEMSTSDISRGVKATSA